MTSPIDFSKKLVKRALERENRTFVKETGGWFGLTGLAARSHWKEWHTTLRRKSPFIIIENDKKRFAEICEEVEKLKAEDPRKAWKISVKYGDLFETMKKVRIGKNTPVFRYGHLDFCITSKVLMREHQLIENLFWLSTWKNLKSPFYLDVTFSRRGDSGMHTSVLNATIPDIFEAAGWKVSNPKRQLIGHRFVNPYREPKQCPMVNALYKFNKKKVKRQEEEPGKWCGRFL